MKAIYLPHSGGAEALAYGDLPVPRPQNGHVLVRVHAAAVTPTELRWFPTSHLPDGSPRPFPVIPGHEFSGTVVEVGPETDGIRVGDAVYGMNDWFADGAQAEFVIAPVATVAAKPVTVSHARAAVVPISALTAWQALTERARLRPGERILIHGAAGGVGLFAVQIAHAAGANVIATASSANVEFVAGLGADTVIDYRSAPFEPAARPVDVVLDLIGGETLGRSRALLRPGGRVVTVASSSATDPDPKVRAAFMLVRADRGQLVEVARRIDDGEWRVFLEREYSLADARAAYARAAQGRMRGKIALRVASEAGPGHRGYSAPAKRFGHERH